MSYDLMVFDAARAPRERGAFLDWYDERTDWDLAQRYDDPQRSSPALQAWFAEMTRTFPPLNGPYAVDAPDDAFASDYTVDAELIYVAFAWSKAEEAYDTMFALAGKHGVGFFDASGETGAVWLPDGRGALALAHEEAG
jgi:hypothetical protein